MCQPRHLHKEPNPLDNQYLGENMLLKGFRFQRCFIIISALSMSVSACNMETSIRKTNVDRTAPDAPVIVLKTPSKIIGINATPTFTISNLEPDAKVELFTDECINKVASITSSGKVQDIISSTISKGRYYFHARQIDKAGNISNCSTSFADYQLSGTPMISTWQTTIANETITLPLRTGYHYHILVDWGDGSDTSLIDSATDAFRVHSYTNPGAGRVITIMGTAEAWSFGSVPASKDKILTVSELGDLGWISFKNAFSNCANISSISGGNTSNVVDMSGMFTLAQAVIDTSNWNTSSVLDMSSMFNNARSANPNTSNWNTSRVTTMKSMFWNAISAQPNTSGWDTSNVTDMSEMFFAAALANPDTSRWATSNVTDMNLMFFQAHQATPTTTHGGNYWDTSKVTNMSNMFNQATLANPDTSGWNTASVTKMDSMFRSATHANPNTSHWNTFNVTTMRSMFRSATLASPDMGTWSFAHVLDCTEMFMGVTLSTAKYNVLLFAIKNTITAPASIMLDAGSSIPNATGPNGTSAKAYIISQGWLVSDGLTPYY